MAHLCCFLCLVFLMLFASIHCCLVVTCWEIADVLVLVGDVYCIFVIFQCGILGPVWYLIVSFPDLCRLSYFLSRQKRFYMTETFHCMLKFNFCTMSW